MWSNTLSHNFGSLIVWRRHLVSMKAPGAMVRPKASRVRKCQLDGRLPSDDRLLAVSNQPGSVQTPRQPMSI